MALAGPALLVRVHLGEADHHDGRPLYGAVVDLLHARGVAGATVLRGVEGYGRSSRVHTTRILRLAEDLPVVVEAVDTEETIRAILPELTALVGGALVTLERVEVVGTAG